MTLGIGNAKRREIFGDRKQIRRYKVPENNCFLGCLKRPRFFLVMVAQPVNVLRAVELHTLSG